MRVRRSPNSQRTKEEEKQEETIASRGQKPASTKDRCRTAETAFSMLYGRIDPYKAQMDNPAPPEHIIDGFTKFALTLVEESRNSEAWDKVKALTTKVEAFADKVTNFSKTHKVKKQFEKLKKTHLAKPADRLKGLRSRLRMLPCSNPEPS